MLRTRALALVATLAISLAGCGTGDAGSSSGAEDRPEAPEGMKLVGAAGVVVAVPESWAPVPADPCIPFLPDRAYVIREARDMDAPGAAERYQELMEECMEERGDRDPYASMPTPQGSAPFPDESLTVTTGESSPMFMVMDDEPVPTMTPSTRDGLDVDHYSTCTRESCEASWFLEDEELFFFVEADPETGAALIEQMDRSIRRLPDGWTTSETDGTVVPDED